MPRVSIGTKEDCAPALFADSGAATPRMSPWPKLRGGLATLFLDHVGGERSEQRTATGRMPRIEPSPVPRMIDQKQVPQVLARRQHAPDACCEHLLLVLALQVEHHVGDAEERHGQRDEAEPVGELRQAEGEADDARIHVGADQAQENAEAHHGDGLEQRSAGEHHRGDEPEHHQREIIGRTELERQLGERGGEERNAERRDAAGHERSDRRDAEARARRDHGEPSGGHRES